MCRGKWKISLRSWLTPSRDRLRAKLECARNSSLILTLGWIAISCGFSPASSAQPIGLQEVLSIEGFFDIADITVGRDESIYVADRGDFSISKYDSQGQLISRLGSQGVAPGEFVNGPRSIALIGSTVIASDQKGTGAMHFFDLDLNYEGTAEISLPMDMDTGPNELLYFGATDLTDLTTLKRYVSTYVPHGKPSRIFELRDMHKHNIENFFYLLAGYPEKIVIVFYAVNRIDVYDLSGNMLDRLSVANLPLRYEGRPVDFGELPLLPDHVVESISYVPGGFMFTSAVLDHKGNLFLEHGGKDGERTVSRSVYVMTLAGEEKGVFKMPPYTHLIYVDKKGYAYAVTTTESSDVLKKYKLKYLE
ncbi:MAG: hypothetical protein F4069_02445 [Rhodothermaceae bacterium]|nr:hypothetical protein [Rhodothermaceae bacterium]MYG70614.1 hypothetical protein [Rhodothermaceae bacterium]MYJ44181.1 hypothetical protein [Rhodothermaceae bacterium]